MVDKEVQDAPDLEERQFARNMQKMREGQGWSQSELARKMVEAGWSNYNQMTVSRTEKGERPIRLSEAKALARIFGSHVEEMSASDERYSVNVALKATASAYEALAEAAKEFLQAQNELSIRADSATIAGGDIDPDAVEGWLETSPESVMTDAAFNLGDVKRHELWREARDLGLSLGELEEHHLEAATAAGFETYEEYQLSLTPQLKFIHFLDRARNGEHPEED